VPGEVLRVELVESALLVNARWFSVFVSSPESRAVPDVRAVWGKAGSGSVPHPLICHALDTAAVAELLVDVYLGPYARGQLLSAFEPLGTAREWAAVLCGLHDLGKCSPAFQGLKAALSAELLGDAEARDVGRLIRWRQTGVRTDMPHGLLTAVHLERVLSRWGASGETARVLARVLGGHHGVIPEAAAVRQAGHAVGARGGRSWQLKCDAIAAEACRLWGLPEPSELAWSEVTVPVTAAVALAGLTTVSDWIASTLPPASYAGADVDLGTYAAVARRAAARNVTALGWTPWHGPDDTRFTALFPADVTPRPVQLAVQDVAGRAAGPVIMVVSAPTGEGKTKAALQAAVTLMRRLELNGFYAALPSRASSNQAFEVADQLLAPFGQADRLRLVHSSPAAYLLARRRMRAGGEMRFYEIAADETGLALGGDDEPGELIAEDWFTRRRGLLAPFGAGTVDQVLTAAIRSSHVFVRLAGLSGKVIIFDEVHSYDVHMSILLDRLLWWLGSLRVSVVLLSATLSSGKQRRLVDSWQAGALGHDPGQAPPAAPRFTAYPRVTWADSAGSAPVEQVAGVAPLNHNRHVELVRVAYSDHVAWALGRAREGQCVAIVHNVVRHAVTAWEELLQQLDSLGEAERPVTILLHGRLTDAERARAEAAVRRMFGPPTDPGAEERPAQAVVVGTQVLEQSLDLDFDVMVSAMAPVDSLIQRMGRIQRHRRDGRRPPMRMALTGVEHRRGRVTFLPYTTRVYDEAVLLRTCAVLRDRAEVVCPDDVQGMVDSVYDIDDRLRCPAGWDEQWAHAHAKLRERIAREEFIARTIYLPPVDAAVRFNELTSRRASPRRTRRDDPRGGDHAGG
jgi:CRISPR-associated endonuclease/helicase Cas3